jgi:ABC-type nitrate/sulfonate/bicarbonate transport system permease component
MMWHIGSERQELMYAYQSMATGAAIAILHGIIMVTSPLTQSALRCMVVGVPPPEGRHMHPQPEFR